MYEYQATVLRVVDGDTLDLEVDLGLDVHIRTKVRLYGINCPEMNTDAGKAAKAYVVDWVAQYGPIFTIRTIKDRREKYGRYLAYIYRSLPDGDLCSLNDDLVSTGNAVVYLP